MQITILEGATFCVSDEFGDLGEPTTGFFDSDTRFLSRLLLTVNGARPLLLSHGKVEYFSSAWFLRNPPVGGLRPDEVSIARRRFVGDGMQEHVILVNHAERPRRVRAGARARHGLRRHLLGQGVRSRARRSRAARLRPSSFPPSSTRAENGFVFSAADEFDGQTQVLLSRPGEIEGGTVRYRVALEPRERWQLRIDVFAVQDGMQIRPAPGRAPLRRRDRPDSRLARRVAAPGAAAACSWDDLGRALRALGLGSRVAADARDRHARAAACSGHAVVHGRLRPRHAHHVPPDAALRAGARPERAPHARRAAGDGGLRRDRRRAGEDRPRGSERQGRPRLVPALLRHVRRHAALPDPPLRGLALDGRRRARVRTCGGPRCGRSSGSRHYGDLDGDGFVEYQRRSEKGLENQSWKDSGVSQKFADGRLAESPIAPVEVQGYVYDAKLRTAELAREVWRDRELAERLEREAAELRERFNEAFWVERRGGYYALALDRHKQPVDSLCSNIGHLSDERHRPARTGRRGRRRADGRGALVGLGRAHDVLRRTPASTRSSTTTGRSGRTTTR